MNDIHYHHVESLGFERMDYNDSVVFRKTGHHPFHMSKKLPGRLVIYWHSEDRTCEMLRLDKKNNVIGRIIFNNLHNLCVILEFYGFEEEVKNLKKIKTLSALVPLWQTKYKIP